MKRGGDWYLIIGSTTVVWSRVDLLCVLV